jgi:hypothetical protein
MPPHASDADPRDERGAPERQPADPLVETTRKGFLFAVSGALLLVLGLILRIEGYY